MRMQFTSKKFVDELKRRATEFKGRRIAARIHVPDDMRWWYFHEFGTATHATQGTNWPYGYPIFPKNPYGHLRWEMGAGHQNFKSTGSGPTGTVIVPWVGNPGGAPGIPAGNYTLNHPGVPAKNYVGSVVAESGPFVADRVCFALLERGFNFNVVRDTLMTNVMPRIKELIARTMDEAIPGAKGEGKLQGMKASWEFEARATIEEVT